MLKMSRIKRFVLATIHGVEKRPWIPMVIYLVAFALFVLASGLLLADMIDSRWRPFGDFTKEEKAVISDVGDYIGWAVVAAGVFSCAVVPLIMLCAGRFRAAFNTLVMGIAGIGASVTFFFLTGPLWFVIGLESAKATDAFGDKGAEIEFYKTYDEAASSGDVRKILPPGAKDITVVRKLYFQGHSVDFRCSLPEEDFKKFVAKRKYVFKEYNLAEGGSGWSFRWNKEDDALFSQFPDVVNGQVVDHHPEGYLTCVANDHLDGGNPNEETLLYVYDKKCSILWAQCWR